MERWWLHRDDHIRTLRARRRGWRRSHGSPYPGTNGETLDTDKRNPTDHSASPRPYRTRMWINCASVICQPRLQMPVDKALSEKSPLREVARLPRE